jgi:hypothetical protein
MPEYRGVPRAQEFITREPMLTEDVVMGSARETRQRLHQRAGGPTSKPLAKTSGAVKGEVHRRLSRYTGWLPRSGLACPKLARR